MTGLKNRGKVLPSLADRLELPEDALLGAAKLTVTAGSRALIENHKGILEYSRDRITVAAGKQRLSVNGSELRIQAMNQREILICGKLQDVEWS